MTISISFSFSRPDIKWYRDQEEVLESPKYQFYRAIQPSNPNIHFVRLTIVVSCLITLNTPQGQLILKFSIEPKNEWKYFSISALASFKWVKS